MMGIYFFKIYFIDYAIIVVPFFFLSFIPLCPASLLPPAFLHLSSCLWVVHISSLASPFPILFLTSPVYFVPTIYASYSLYLFPHSTPPPHHHSPSLVHVHGLYIYILWLLHFLYYS